MKFNVKRFALLLVAVFAATSFLKSQDDDLLSLIEEEETIDYVTASFKTTRIVNTQSLENVSGGVFDLKISHRFGFVNQGVKELFGLDQATIRIGGDYGISDQLMIGVGRSSFEKVYDGFFKYKLLRQSTGLKRMPISALAYGSAMVKTVDFSDEDRENFNSSRWYYSGSLILGRKFSDQTTLQIMPTVVHRNLVESRDIENMVLIVGVGGRQRISRRVTLNAEYFYVLPDQIDDKYYNSLSIGFDIETGGHVFQLHFTNSTAMIDKGYMTETVGDWLDGDIHFGFNVSRVFTVKKPKEFKD